VAAIKVLFDVIYMHKQFVPPKEEHMIAKSCNGCGLEISDDLVIQLDKKEILCPLCYLMRKMRGNADRGGGEDMPRKLDH
jgi:hypothetical protein